MVQAALTTVLLALAAGAAVAGQNICSPDALALTPDGATLYVGCAAGNRVEVIDTRRGEAVRQFPMPGPVTGLAVAADGSRVYATCAGARSTVQVIPSGRAIKAGHTAGSPVLSPDGKLLYVCNRFDNDISIVDLAVSREIGRVRVTREPESAALSADGRWLLVANALPAGRADAALVAAEISVVDTTRRTVAATVPLPNGSTNVHQIRISPDGRTACVTHLLARYTLPATQIDRGWVQTNAVSLIDLAGSKRRGTVLLDEIDRGAANPWALAWDGAGKSLLVSHAGTHEVSAIDWPALERKLAGAARDPAEDLSFLVGLRRRIPLHGNGPRAIAAAGSRVWVAGYFSDTIEAFDLDAPSKAPVVVARFSHDPPGGARRGEMLFNDGRLSFQGWLSCASCHGPDARVDGLNWDLLNDGIGNPKNAKSLLLAHRTPPAMSQGVREDAEEAVRAGIRYILFAERPDRDAVAIDEYLRNLQPVPSPYLRHGRLTAAAERGRKIFHDAAVGCANCHPEGLFTDLHSYDVGTRARTDTTAVFDTPTLIEIWRTAPYLHDGSAATLREVVTTANPADKHGKTSHLSPAQIEDLVAYLQCL